MQEDAYSEELIRGLEERLLDPAVRSSIIALEALLDDGFVEIGASGQMYTKAQVIAGLATQIDWQVPELSDVRIVPLAGGTAHITYRARRAMTDGSVRQTLRSSIWKQIDGRWKMVFHQGTPAKAD